MKCKDCERFFRFEKSQRKEFCGEIIEELQGEFKVAVIDEDSKCFNQIAYPQGKEKEKDND